MFYVYLMHLCSSIYSCKLPRMGWVLKYTVFLPYCIAICVTLINKLKCLFHTHEVHGILYNSYIIYKSIYNTSKINKRNKQEKI